MCLHPLCFLSLLALLNSGAAWAGSNASPLEKHCAARIDTAGIERLPRLLIFGEIHGTEEAPALIGKIACDLLQRPEKTPIQIGLELPRESDTELQNLLSAPGSTSARQALLATALWSGEYQDGRSSVSVLRLIEQIGHLKAAGAVIDLFAFDTSNAPSAEARDQAMAEAIDQRFRQHAMTRMLILTGNSHAQKSPHTIKPRWMAEFLKTPSQRYGLAASGGSSWNCTGPLPSHCAAHPQKAGGGVTDRPVDTRLRDAKPDLSGRYDAILLLGPTIASAPAKKVFANETL